MKKQNQKIIITGFADDLAVVVSRLGSRSVETIQVTENATNEAVPKSADFIIYVMSKDSVYSTQLHSIFVYIHDQVVAGREYLLSVEDIDLREVAFPEVSHLPQISVIELQNILERAGKTELADTDSQ